MEQTSAQTDQSRSIATLTNELLEDLTNPSMSAFEMCQIHELTLIELAAILSSESFKLAVEAIEKIANARSAILEPEARALATARLADILKDKPSTPAHAETQRKAATHLLRLPRASVGAPKGGSGCEADGGGLLSPPQPSPDSVLQPVGQFSCTLSTVGDSAEHFQGVIMNTKVAATGVLALGTTVLGAAIYLINSSDSSPEPGTPLASTISSRLMDAPSPDFASESATQRIPEAPKQAGHVIQRTSNEKTGWAAMMERMSEFDADGDGVLSKLEKIAMGEQLKKEWMEKYDLDGDGEISPEEMEAFQVDQFINSDWGQDMMRKFDADGDGILNAEEEIALRANIAELEEQKRLEELAQLDTNNDGEISEPEREVQREQQRQWWANAKESAVENHDADGDGELNIEESQNAWDAWIAQQSITDFINRYDANNDGSMGAGDYSEFISNYSNGDLAADVNRDGVINLLDLNAYTDLVTRANN